jgi:hypothetical protein
MSRYLADCRWEYLPTTGGRSVDVKDDRASTFADKAAVGRMRASDENWPWMTEPIRFRVDYRPENQVLPVRCTGHAGHLAGWASPTSVDPSGGGLSAVSCPTAAFCVAGDEDGNAVTYNGATWGSPTSVDPSGGGLRSLSCPTATFCAAADNAGDALLDHNTLWGAPTSLEIEGSVSCASASFCAVVGGGDAATTDGTTWNTYGLIAFAEFGSVSCPTDEFCALIDGSVSASTYTSLLWSASVRIDGDKLGTGIANSVSCPTTTFCMAVDQLGHAIIGRVKAPPPATTHIAAARLLAAA